MWINIEIEIEAFVIGIYNVMRPHSAAVSITFHRMLSIIWIVPHTTFGMPIKPCPTLIHSGNLTNCWGATCKLNPFSNLRSFLRSFRLTTSLYITHSLLLNRRLIFRLRNKNELLFRLYVLSYPFLLLVVICIYIWKKISSNYVDGFFLIFVVNYCDL